MTTETAEKLVRIGNYIMVAEPVYLNRANAVQIIIDVLEANEQGDLCPEW